MAVPENWDRYHAESGRPQHLDDLEALGLVRVVVIDNQHRVKREQPVPKTDRAIAREQAVALLTASREAERRKR